ncbi:MAG: radical SAM protein [Candidatus Kryptoniota bacterium]
MKLGFLHKLGSLRTVSTVGSILTPLVRPGIVPYPYMLTFVVTRRCNSRCIMCNLWQDKTSPILSLDQIEQLFSQNDFSFIRVLVLTGGEPTLRPDLPEIFKIISTHCPNLELVQLATNGLNPSRILAHVQQMLRWVETKHGSLYRFDVQISLDGVGEAHDKIRGVPNAFHQAVETIDQLVALKKDFPRLGIRLSAIVVPQNFFNLGDLKRFALERGLLVSFSPAVLSGGYYSNLESKEVLSFSIDQQVLVSKFFEHLAQVEESSLKYYYKDMKNVLLGKPRQRRCMMGFYGFVLEHDGGIYPCVNCELQSWGNLIDISFDEIWFGPRAALFRREMVRECCQRCTSLCYPLAVNAFEVIDLVVSRIVRRIRNHFRH